MFPLIEVIMRLVIRACIDLANMKRLESYRVSMGCDPEFFFARQGKIIGSEKLLSEEGYSMPSTETDAPRNQHRATAFNTPKIIIDGVQAELNPRPHDCRATLANEIAWCMRKIVKNVLRGEATIDFSQAVEVSQEELDSLSDRFKVFGCSPSRNVYSADGQSHIEVDPMIYRTRAAGGHIHLGPSMHTTLAEQALVEKALKNYEVIVPILDLIVGNTCVLVDRNPSNIERRKVYGKAGEHRTPEYGVEYRTLSNFWLGSYPLFGLAFGLARLAVLVVANDTETFSYSKALLSKVKQADVVKAINDNDFDLALANFNAIKETLLTMVESNDFISPINKSNVAEFEHFITKPMSEWFKASPIEAWCDLQEGHSGGFETFMTSVVRHDMKK